MDELRALLDRAAAHVAPPPPTVAELTTRRRSQIRTRAAVIISAVCVAALAVVVVVAVRPSSRPSDASAALSISAAPPPPSISPSSLRGYRWQALPVAPIAPRDGAATVWTGREVFVWGGTTGHHDFADGALYDPLRRTWSTLPPAPLPALSYATAVVVGRYVIVWARSGAVGGARYDLDTHRWEPVAAPPGTSASGGPFAGALIGSRDRAILFRPGRAQPSPALQVAAYDPVANRWTSLPAIDGQKDHDVTLLSAVAVGSDVYAWPSWSHDTKQSANSSGFRYGIDAYRLDKEAQRWVPTVVAPDPGSSASGAQAANGGVLFPQSGSYCGGCHGPPRLSIESAIVSTHGVRRTVSNGPLGAGGDNPYWVGSGVLSYNASSRFSGPGFTTSPGDLAFWDSESGSWTRLPSAPISDQLSPGNEVWTGTRFIVWGLTTPRGTRAATGGLEFAPR